MLRVIRCLPPREGGRRWHGGGNAWRGWKVTACGGRRLISLEGGHRGQGDDEVWGGYGDWMLTAVWMVRWNPAEATRRRGSGTQNGSLVRMGRVDLSRDGVQTASSRAGWAQRCRRRLVGSAATVPTRAARQRAVLMDWRPGSRAALVGRDRGRRSRSRPSPRRRRDSDANRLGQHKPRAHRRPARG